MYCLSCGAVVGTGKKFCARCGTPVATGAGVPQAKSSKAWLIAVLVCLILLAGAAGFLIGGGYFGLARAPSPPEASQVQARFRPELPPPPPPPPAASAPEGSPAGGGGAPGGVPGGVVGGIVPPPERAPQAPESKPQPIRVSGNVQAAKLIRQPQPAYPPLAKQARIQGTVRLTAVIGADGAIQQLQLISGHPLLVPAAQEAVRQWVYQPTLLHGEPVEVVTQIDVVFVLERN